MNKLLVGLPVIAAVVFAGVPFMTGIVAEKKSKELIDVVNLKSDQYGTVEITNYDRGFMSSNSSYKYSLSPAFQKLTNIDNIEYDCLVDHGVTGVDYACTMAKKGAYQGFLEKYLEGKDPLTMTGNISAFGGIDHTVSIEPVSLDLADGSKVNISEKIAFITEYDQSSAIYDFSGVIPSISFEKGDTLSVENIRFSGNIKEFKEGLYVGDVKMSGEQLTTEGEKGSFKLNGFNVDTSTKESANTVSSSMSMKAKSVELPNPSGQTDTFSDFTLDAGMYGMDADALVEYIKVNQDIQRSLLDAGNNEAAQAQAGVAEMSQLIPVAEKLLQKGLGLNLKSSFESDGTNNNVSLDLSMLNAMKFNEMMGFLFSPDETLKNFKGSLNIDVKKELLEKYPQLALTVGGIPFFVQTKDGTTLDVALDSVLKVNGEETTVAELQSLFR